MEHNDQITKDLVSLIDETISEIDELRKSRYAAAEVDIHGPGDSINADGACPNGKLGKEECEDEGDEGDEEDKKDEKAEKAANREADPDPGFPHGKAEAKKADVEKAANREADPDPGFPHGKAEAKKAEKEDDDGDDDDDDKKKDKIEKQAGTELGGADMSSGANAAGVNQAVKSEKEDGEKLEKDAKEKAEELFKSYVDSRINPLEERLKTIQELVAKIAEQPVPSKRLASKMVALEKGEDDFTQSLSKSGVTDQLMELKKSGKEVDELDFTKIDLGADLAQMARKYGLK